MMDILVRDVPGLAHNKIFSYQGGKTHQLLKISTNYSGMHSNVSLLENEKRV